MACCQSNPKGHASRVPDFHPSRSHLLHACLMHFNHWHVNDRWRWCILTWHKVWDVAVNPFARLIYIFIESVWFFLPNQIIMYLHSTGKSYFNTFNTCKSCRSIPEESLKQINMVNNVKLWLIVGNNGDEWFPNGNSVDQWLLIGNTADRHLVIGDIGNQWLLIGNIVGQWLLMGSNGDRWLLRRNNGDQWS